MRLPAAILCVISPESSRMDGQDRLHGHADIRRATGSFAASRTGKPPCLHERPFAGPYFFRFYRFSMDLSQIEHKYQIYYSLTEEKRLFIRKKRKEGTDHV